MCRSWVQMSAPVEGLGHVLQRRCQLMLLQGPSVKQDWNIWSQVLRPPPQQNAFRLTLLRVLPSHLQTGCPSCTEAGSVLIIREESQGKAQHHVTHAFEVTCRSAAHLAQKQVVC